MSLGPKVPKLTLEGVIYEEGKTADELEKDYIEPLRDMVWYGMATRRVLFDDNGTGFWTAASGTGSDDSSDYVKGESSYSVTVSSAALDIYHDWSTSQNFELQDFISLWIKGANTGKYIYIYFWNENYASRTNGFYAWITDDFTEWRRYVIPKTCFVNKNDPDGWNIKCVEIKTIDSISATLKFDRLAVGVGHELVSPYERYNGIYLVADFRYEERAGYPTSFPYTLTLLSQDDHY